MELVVLIFARLLYCYYDLSGGGGNASGKPSRPWPNSRPELVPGPSAPPQAVWGVWSPGLVYCTVLRRCCFHPSWSTTPGVNERICSESVQAFPAWIYDSLVYLFFVFFPYTGAQFVQLYQGGWGFRVARACEALFQTDAGVQTPVDHSHEPRRQATGSEAQPVLLYHQCLISCNCCICNINFFFFFFFVPAGEEHHLSRSKGRHWNAQGPRT